MRAIFIFPFLVALGAAMGLTTSAAQPVAAATSTLPGIDVSHHNGKPDWAAVKQDGVKFVIAKATEDTPFQDPEYATNKRMAEAQGLAFTAYHFAAPDKTAG